MTSEIKVNKVSDSCGSALVTKCGSNITIGASGKTILLACGASQTGFGRSGSVDWCTTAKTSPFSGVSGKGYFINTTSGAVTITLPSSPSAGAIISVKDYANTFDTNNVTIGRGGSKIGGQCIDATLGTEGQAVTLVYVDALDISVVDSTTGDNAANSIEFNTDGTKLFVLGQGQDLVNEYALATGFDISRKVLI